VKASRKYVVVEKHARVAIGKTAYYEIPTGMDTGEESFLGVIKNLMQDEVGIDMSTESFVNMNAAIYHKNEPIYMSPGVSDEAVNFFLVEICPSHAQLAYFKEAVSNHVGRKQYVEPDIIPLNELVLRCADAKSIIAVQLYHLYKSIESQGV